MSKTNTEKPSGKAEQKKKGLVETSKKQKVANTPVKEENKKESPKQIKDIKKKVVQKEKVKKSEAVVKASNLPISTKDAVAICRFIRYKKIGRAIQELEEVITKKRAIPMKGEIPHRKGNIMSGRFPLNATNRFLILLKSLASNSIENGIDNPIIYESIANKGERPFGRFGRWRRKRTHVTIKVMERSKLNKIKGKKK